VTRQKRESGRVGALDPKKELAADGDDRSSRGCYVLAEPSRVLASRFNGVCAQTARNPSPTLSPEIGGIQGASLSILLVPGVLRCRLWLRSGTFRTGRSRSGVEGGSR